MLDESILSLLGETDRVLLDIKYTDPKQYETYVGCSMDAPLAFLKTLEEKEKLVQKNQQLNFKIKLFIKIAIQELG